jgi:hypothetical protein
MEGMGFYGIPHKCLRLLPRRPLVHLTHLINHYLRLGHFPAPWKEAKIITMLNPAKNPKISAKFTSDQPFSNYGQTVCEANFKNNPKTH